MRLDLFLKKTMIVKRRAVANELVRSGRVLLNGSLAKPGREVKPDDILQLPLHRRRLKIRIKEIPTRPVKKGMELTYYEILEEETV
ncbi:MAG: RNA-binding protein [Acidobacteria bacterium CG_4_9_14_3_um_filter_49_7]|nr:MAG: RNA-binding protein [Acidobacteria bacterium CG_4_9_14_3_um_filter_49_7]